MSKDMICCKEFEDNVSERVEVSIDGVAIEGCCGGGCFVIYEMKFCPFCGKKFVLGRVDE